MRLHSLMMTAASQPDSLPLKATYTFSLPEVLKPPLTFNPFKKTLALKTLTPSENQSKGLLQQCSAI